MSGRSGTEGGGVSWGCMTRIQEKGQNPTSTTSGLVTLKSIMHLILNFCYIVGLDVMNKLSGGLNKKCGNFGYLCRMYVQFWYHDIEEFITF